MKTIDMSKLHSANEVLDSKYGREGTESRKDFDAKAKAYYYGTLLRERRKQLKISQAELASQVGTARSYIARIEKGETDMQLSNFFRIATALHINFTPVYA